MACDNGTYPCFQTSPSAQLQSSLSVSRYIGNSSLTSKHLSRIRFTDPPAPARSTSTCWIPICYDGRVENRTEPKTAGQWVRYIVVAVIALFLVWWMLRLYVL
jgi:hypothetical protein